MAKTSITLTFFPTCHTRFYICCIYVEFLLNCKRALNGIKVIIFYLLLLFVFVFVSWKRININLKNYRNVWTKSLLTYDKATSKVWATIYHLIELILINKIPNNVNSYVVKIITLKVNWRVFLNYRTQQVMWIEFWMNENIQHIFLMDFM